MDTPKNIKFGDYVIIQRQKYTKLHKFGNVDTTAALGKDQIELGNIVDHPYFTTFRMVPKEGSKNKRLFTLTPCADVVNLKEEILNGKESGVDNRNILDDGLSQALSNDEIVKLRESCTSSSEIVNILVENSKTFNSKTEYSQEKYLRKKEKKYFEFVQIRRPTVRILIDIFYRQDPDKIMGIRVDSLSQIISYSGVFSSGNYLLYESGTNGLAPAAMLNSMGARGTSQLVHMHPGNVSQKQAVLALNLSAPHMARCISVNIYSVLRQFYQSDESPAEELKSETDSLAIDDNDEGGKRKLADAEPEDVPLKIQKTHDTSTGVVPKTKWMLENDRVCELLREKLDSLVVIAREHPTNIVKELLPFVKPGRPVVLFSLSREILMECFVEFKSTNTLTGVRLTSNWMRHYQILPNRTHPMVNMSANSGYILTGYTIE